MSEPQFKHLSCPVAVFHIEDAQVTGDSLADEVRNELLAAYTQVNAVHAVVDLSKVQFLSSAGFRPLLSLLRLTRVRGGRLVLCGLSEHLHEPFAVTRLISTTGSTPATFESAPDVPSAVALLFRAGTSS